MTREQFHATLRDGRAFTLRLDDGRCFEIGGLERVALGETRGAAFDEKDCPRIFLLASVVSLTPRSRNDEPVEP